MCGHYVGLLWMEPKERTFQFAKTIRLLVKSLPKNQCKHRAILGISYNSDCNTVISAYKYNCHVAVDQRLLLRSILYEFSSTDSLVRFSVKMTPQLFCFIHGAIGFISRSSKETWDMTESKAPFAILKRFGFSYVLSWS